MIPQDKYDMLKTAVYQTWNAIAPDVNLDEGYTSLDIVEMCVDANHMASAGGFPEADHYYYSLLGDERREVRQRLATDLNF